jgi:hypothetical protein
MRRKNICRKGKEEGEDSSKTSHARGKQKIPEEATKS